MSWFHEHLALSVFLIWLAGAICTYLWMRHADQDPSLSGDEIMPPIIEMAMAAFWFITAPMMFISKLLK